MKKRKHINLVGSSSASKGRFSKGLKGRRKGATSRPAPPRGRPQE